VAYDETCPCFQASFCVVIELVLPGVDLGWANVQARLVLAFLAQFSADYDEGFGILGEAYHAKPLVEADGSFGF